MSMSVQTQVVLEPAAQEIADATSKPPLLYELDYAAARKVLEDLQAGDVERPPIDEEWISVPSPAGDARVRLIKPQGLGGVLPAIVYMHGGGWVLGNAFTHDRLVRELAVGAKAALAFVEYPNSPEAHYPVAIEQGYATAQWIVQNGASKGIDGNRMAVVGESVGGDMTAALTLMAKERGDVQFVHAGMYYPVTGVLRGVRRRPVSDPQGDGVVLGCLHHRPGGACGDHRFPQPGHGRAAEGAPTHASAGG
jgi:acetyl esterase